MVICSCVLRVEGYLREQRVILARRKGLREACEGGGPGIAWGVRLPVGDTGGEESALWRLQCRHRCSWLEGGVQRIDPCQNQGQSQRVPFLRAWESGSPGVRSAAWWCPAHAPRLAPALGSLVTVDTSSALTAP